ncbi:hypothetical protein [Microcoleus sp. LEGE 07076]|nr:hypothetical protein [Microcoleus sp. LEGE 07076]
MLNLSHNLVTDLIHKHSSDRFENRSLFVENVVDAPEQHLFGDN